VKSLSLGVALLIACLSNEVRAECAWEGDVKSASATMTTVTINGHLFPVKGEVARTQFMSTLAECGVNSMAVGSFRQWRGMRRATNGTAIAGCLCFFPALLATPITAVMAGTFKDQMIAMLLSN